MGQQLLPGMLARLRSFRQTAVLSGLFSSLSYRGCFAMTVVR